MRVGCSAVEAEVTGGKAMLIIRAGDKIGSLFINLALPGLNITEQKVPSKASQS